MKTKVKTLTFSASSGRIDKEINQAIAEIEKNNIIENIKITSCGRDNIIILIIYKEIKEDNNGLEYLNYCESEDNYSISINESQNTTIYDMKTSL